MVFGFWSLVFGLGSLVVGLWSLVFGFWSLVFSLWSLVLVLGLWSLVKAPPQWCILVLPLKRPSELTAYVYSKDKVFFSPTLVYMNYPRKPYTPKLKQCIPQFGVYAKHHETRENDIHQTRAPKHMNTKLIQRKNSGNDRPCEVWYLCVLGLRSHKTDWTQSFAKGRLRPPPAPPHLTMGHALRPHLVLT